jgi:hypothetical protein
MTSSRGMDEIMYSFFIGVIIGIIFGFLVAAVFKMGG